MTALTRTSRHSTLGRSVVLAACLLTGYFGVAQAAPSDAPSVKVSYNDLDLSTDAGARTLYNRIATAARAVCPDGSTRDLTQFAHSQACRRDAIARAVISVDSARLAAVVADRAKRG